ncbi:MAG: hypothetical protein PHQ23_02700 [Candidatus Wallbacteria bacterium]|nr:hypothetical protein [Candidatus Wallbacteria bacterium]
MARNQEVVTLSFLEKFKLGITVGSVVIGTVLAFYATIYTVIDFFVVPSMAEKFPLLMADFIEKNYRVRFFRFEDIVGENELLLEDIPIAKTVAVYWAGVVYQRQGEVYYIEDNRLKFIEDKTGTLKDFWQVHKDGKDAVMRVEYYVDPRRN